MKRPAPLPAASNARVEFEFVEDRQDYARRVATAFEVSAGGGSVAMALGPLREGPSSSLELAPRILVDGCDCGVGDLAVHALALELGSDAAGAVTFPGEGSGGHLNRESAVVQPAVRLQLAQGLLDLLLAEASGLKLLGQLCVEMGALRQKAQRFVPTRSRRSIRQGYLPLNALRCGSRSVLIDLEWRLGRHHSCIFDLERRFHLLAGDVSRELNTLHLELELVRIRRAT